MGLPALRGFLRPQRPHLLQGRQRILKIGMGSGKNRAKITKRRKRGV